jgi:hypothetical protein
MLRALKTGAESDFDNIGLGGVVPLVDPKAGLAFTLEGSDPQSFELQPAPPLARSSPHFGLKRIKPVVEKIVGHIGRRLQRIRLRGSCPCRKPNLTSS